MEQPRQSLLGRLWADIRANPGVWIGVGITALVLVVGYLAYQNSQNSAAASGATNSGSATDNATNQPDWSSAVLGSNAGGQPSNAEVQAELDAIAAYVQNQQTPNPSGTANPVGLIHIIQLSGGRVITVGGGQPVTETGFPTIPPMPSRPVNIGLLPIRGHPFAFPAAAPTVTH